MGQEGLASFTPQDIASHLDDAMILVHSALIERAGNEQSAWRGGLKRAAEILEWLSQTRLRPPGVPLHLVSAAAYQLAGYPALAFGQLRRMPADEAHSTILRDFLRGHFPDSHDAVLEYWRQQAAGQIESDLTTETFRHVVMCIATVCNYFRTGAEGSVRRALTKLENLAKSFLHSRDAYSFLLARLTAATAEHFVASSLWPHIDALSEGVQGPAREALTQFARSSFVNRRALVWPAQATGIARLRQNDSFVLCTPTGSGKTTVATLAALQGLYADIPQFELNQGNLVLYLVPSRALAAEVEVRLAQDLAGIAARPAVITGLYGGVDWGPTDAWIQNDSATVVICTFEKADALLRYLGVLFLNRVRLVVIDEAHAIEQDTHRAEDLRTGASRAFRLEQLGARLLRARDQYQFRVIALSAVAARAAPALARWVGSRSEAVPTTSTYRSTRQMLGALEVSADGHFTISYSLMDGRSLRFRDGAQAQTPYVTRPFNSLPEAINRDDGPEVRMRAPTLWAALNLAAERPDGAKPSVLISLTQSVDAFAATCADLMNAWPEATLPRYGNVDENDELWQRAFAAAADYFTEESIEYRLLRRAIAVHHGRMPGLLSRRLKALIDRGSVRVVIATSTLSEGVNIPVNYILIPSLFRGPSALGLQEFTNLIGRAGRPGVATEGSALVVLPQWDIRHNRQWRAYADLVNQLEVSAGASAATALQDEASSPLMLLLQSLQAAWSELTGERNEQQFRDWLEQTAVPARRASPEHPAYDYLDSLDGFLIAALQEVEQLERAELAPDALERELTLIWQRTYAFAASGEEAVLRNRWLARGRSINTHYPDAAERRRIYRTSLTPRSAEELLGIQEEVKEQLTAGANYAIRDVEGRFAFIMGVIGSLSNVPAFRVGRALGRARAFDDWPRLLRWWLAKQTLDRQPAPREIPAWYAFVAQNFIYRAAWGLGSVIGLLTDETPDGVQIQALQMDDWPRSGLPWIAFWLKELLTWGTLDPVAAFLMARGEAADRGQAERLAADYYSGLATDTDANDALDPRTIRDWVLDLRERAPQGARLQALEIPVLLERQPNQYRNDVLTVHPLPAQRDIRWVDTAGYTVARSVVPADWPRDSNLYEFVLSVRLENAFVRATPYRQHSH
jgi:superfamily II DNA/RNA helicase